MSGREIVEDGFLVVIAAGSQGGHIHLECLLEGLPAVR
jgi:hypothetical protein